MSLDYDLYVIDPSNINATKYHLRECLKDAIDELASRTASLSERLNKLENEADATDNNVLSKEPLIKDKKIRDIIRPWAKVNGATVLKYFAGENCLEDIFRNEIHFKQLLGLEDDKTYTTDELCGEEEECES